MYIAHHLSLIDISSCHKVVGFSVCESAHFLKVFEDAVEELKKAKDATLSALQSNLESLLEDGLGGEPSVTIKTSDDGLYADLIVDLVLKWNFAEAKTLGLDLAVLLSDVTVPGVDIFQKSILPSRGAEIDVDGHLVVTLALGIEYNGQFKKATPYLIGSTGIEASFRSEGDITFEAALGPLRGHVSANYEAGYVDNRLKLQAGFDASKRYYFKDPETGGSIRVGFTYPSDRSEERRVGKD